MFNPLPADNRTDNPLNAQANASPVHQQNAHKPLEPRTKNRSVNVTFYTTDTNKNNPEESSISLAAPDAITSKESEKPSVSAPKEGASKDAGQQNSLEKDTQADAPAENKSSESDDKEIISSSTPALAKGEEHMLCPVDHMLIDILIFEFNYTCISNHLEI